MHWMKKDTHITLPTLKFFVKIQAVTDLSDSSHTWGTAYLTASLRSVPFRHVLTSTLSFLSFLFTQPTQTSQRVAPK